MNEYNEICDNRKRIGSRIAKIRAEMNISQYKLADMTGLKQSNIARIESGKCSTGIDVLSRMADALGCAVEFINK